MEDFLKEVLGISDYTITYFNGGKDNITALIKTQSDTFVVQKTLLLPQEQQNIIQESIDFLNQNNIRFAKQHGENRFIEFEGATFQIMEYIPGEIPKQEEISSLHVTQIAKYVAGLHNVSQKFDVSKYSGGTNDYKNLDIFMNLAIDYNKKNPDYSELLNELILRRGNIQAANNLPKGMIHGDTAFKNFLYSQNGEILGMIDYEMITADDILWDLVDNVRSYMKLDWFNKKEFWELINAYESIRPLNTEEKENLENYLKMIILNTGSRYFLSLFDGSDFSNQMGDKNDSIEKTKRCLKEYDKAALFFK